MNDILTIPAYHYVRPIATSTFPATRGLELAEFEGQLDYIEKHYHVVSVKDVVAAAHGGAPLPARPLLLTFDDGYADHYRYVFPILRRRKISGVFFPSAYAVTDRRLLEVNKIHFILAGTSNHSLLVTEIDQFVESARDEFSLRPLQEYRDKYFGAPDPYDSAEDIYIKRMLQHALPEGLRYRITSELFRRHVTADESTFADELYLSEDDLREMISGGMEVGGHGDSHHWLERLPKDAQAADIDGSFELLARLGIAPQGASFCYPYGSYNHDTLDLLRARGCAAAFTTRCDLARVNAANLLELPRIDTNDLPRTGEARPVHWTETAAQPREPLPIR